MVEKKDLCIYVYVLQGAVSGVGPVHVRLLPGCPQHRIQADGRQDRWYVLHVTLKMCSTRAKLSFT